MLSKSASLKAVWAVKKRHKLTCCQCDPCVRPRRGEQLEAHNITRARCWSLLCRRGRGAAVAVAGRRASAREAAARTCDWRGGGQLLEAARRRQPAQPARPRLGSTVTPFTPQSLHHIISHQIFFHIKSQIGLYDLFLTNFDHCVKNVSHLYSSTEVSKVDVYTTCSIYNSFVNKLIVFCLYW